MAEKEGKEPDAMKDLLWFVCMIIGLGIAWAVTGGYQRTVQKLLNPVTTSGNSVVPDVSTTGGFFGQPAIINFHDQNQIISQGSSASSGVNGSAGQANRSTTPNYSDIYSPERISAPIAIANRSPFFNQVVLQTGSISSNPNQEYLVLTTSHNIPYAINITGWTLHSVPTGATATIGKGEQLPFSNFISAADESPIYLEPGEQALVTTGVSPIGGSFEENECTGYFNQFNSFYPSIDYSCPALSSEILPQPPNALDDACLDYIQGFSRCIAPDPTKLPATLSYQCQQFISNHESYGECVQYHKPDANFYSNVWRIYLANSASLWKTEREEIELLDSNGKIVDVIGYNY
jgi:hypothetical protein